MVAADHRLMPEATGLEILDDIADFWSWVRNHLGKYLSQIAPGIEPDLEHVLCAGASAGGYLAVQSGMSQPIGSIKAIVAAYPMLDIGSDWFTKEYTKELNGVKTLPRKVLDDHLAAIKPGDVVTASTPPERFPLAIATVQQGRFKELLGEDPVLYPVERLKDVKELPFIFAYHATDDTSVPVEGTVKFAHLVKEMFGADSVHLYTGPGWHGFDVPESLDNPWLKEGLDKVTKLWLEN